MKKPRKESSAGAARLDRVLGYADALCSGYGDEALLRSDAYIQGMADCLWRTDRDAYYRLYAEYQAANAERI